MPSCATLNDRNFAPKVAKIEINNWRELRSPDFILYSHGSKEDLEKAALDLARFVAMVEHLVEAQPPKTPARIFLLDDFADKLYIPWRRVLGYMDHSLTGFDGMMRGSAHDPVNRGVLLHEFTHYLNLRNTKLNYPSWYVEGFAEFLGPTRTRGDLLELGSAPPWRLHTLSLRQSRNQSIDLAEIFSFEKKGDWSYPPDFYAISWATVHFLNGNADRNKRLISMVELQSMGADWRDAYSRSFSEPIEELQKKVEGHAASLAKGTPAAVAYLPLEDLEVRTRWAIREVSPQETLQLLGDVALRSTASRGEDPYFFQLAEALYKRSLRLDPKNSRVKAGLSAALAAQKKFELSATWLKSFDKDPTPSAAALVHAGNSIQLRAMSLTKNEQSSKGAALQALAIERYRRALDSEPTNASALAGLGRSQLETGAIEEARISLAEAQANGEWDANLAIARGRVERKLGSNDLARAFWQEVVRLGSEAAAKRASELLDGVKPQK